MSGEANDAVSAYTQVKVSDVTRLVEFLVTECQTVWIRLPRNRRPNGTIRTQSVWPSSGRTESHVKIKRDHSAKIKRDSSAELTTADTDAKS